MSNIPTKIKHNLKSSDEFEDKCEINYQENYESKKTRQKFTKQKLGDRKCFLDESKSKFD